MSRRHAYREVKVKVGIESEHGLKRRGAANTAVSVAHELIRGDDPPV